jgi:hypothetical protein
MLRRYKFVWVTGGMRRARWSGYERFGVQRNRHCDDFEAVD